jgi:hypothetical protein
MARGPKRRKAKKAAPKTGTKKAAKAVAKTRVEAVVPASGPVTLEEARALAQARQPTLALEAVGKTAAPPASPAAVGAERQKLKKEQRDERARRVREYKATMDIMKKRGGSIIRCRFLAAASFRGSSSGLASRS